MSTKNNENYREYDGVGSCPQELSQEIAKFAIANAAKDASKLNAAFMLTAHDTIDEDGDEALEIAALIGGSPSTMVDLLIEVMETVCETRPKAAIRIHEALLKFMRKKVAEELADNKDSVIEALESLVRALAKNTEK